MTATTAMIPKDVAECLKSRWWRLNNLYYIKGKDGQKIKFQLNWAQLELYRKMHYCNLVLKARQLGITTFFAIYFLDMCIFNSNINAAIVADRNSNSREIFRDKVKFAYDNLNPVIKNIAPAHRDNANEYRFENGSSYRVACSLRGGTTQLLHISEFGKICREFPKKAQEIVAGALNTVQAGQFITIESTAEGRDGYFYDMVHNAQKKQDLGEKLGPLDYKLFFFPWYKEKSYTLDFSDEEAKRIENKIVVA